MANNLQSSVGAALVGLLCFSLAACEELECGRYDKYVESDKEREALLHWVDVNLFSKTFSDADLRSGSLVGPGVGLKSISEERSGIKFPSWMRGYEVRILGPNQYRPNAFFIGQRRYQGLIITREELNKSLLGTDVNPKLLYKKGNRVASMCYQEKENMLDKSK